jgi:prefoldin subunit 5
MITQDQINAIAKSYSEEVNRLLEIKANLTLALQAAGKAITEKDKEIAALKKQLQPVENKEPIPTNGRE